MTEEVLNQNVMYIKMTYKEIIKTKKSQPFGLLGMFSRHVTTSPQVRRLDSITCLA